MARDIRRIMTLTIIGIILGLGVLTYGIVRFVPHLSKKEVAHVEQEYNSKSMEGRTTFQAYVTPCEEKDNYGKGLGDALVFIGSPLCFYFCKKCIDYWSDHRYMG